MKRLLSLSNAELIAEAKRRIDKARENDRQLGEKLAGLLASVDEMGRRLDEHGG